MIVLRRPYDAEQKEFSRLTEAIKGARRTWASKLTERIKENARELARRDLIATSSQPLENPTIEDKLVKMANDQGKLVHPAMVEPFPSNSLVDELVPKDFTPGETLTILNPPHVVTDLVNKLEGRTEFISHPKYSGSERLAHELGHLENSKPLKHPISWLNSKLANSKKTRQGYADTVYDRDEIPPSGWGETMRRYIASKSINHEEKVANKRGIKILKKVGATPEELERSKVNLKLNEDTTNQLGEFIG